MKVYNFCPITYFDFEEDHILFIENSTIVKGNLAFEELPLKEKVPNEIGGIQMKQVLNSFNIIGPTESETEPPPNGLLPHQHLSFNEYLGILWLIKDNSVSTEFGCAISSGGFVSTSHIIEQNTNAAGEYETVRFTIAEIEWLKSTYKIFGKLFSVNISDLNEISSMMDQATGQFYRLIDEAETSRLTRSWNAISRARMTFILNKKIADYVQALESLFSTNGAEISFRIQCYVPLFLGMDSVGSLKVASLLKLAYDVRSKHAHGDVLSKKSSAFKYGLKNISREVDTILRQIIIKIISMEGSEDLKIFTDQQYANDYFLNKIFAR